MNCIAYIAADERVDIMFQRNIHESLQDLAKNNFPNTPYVLLNTNELPSFAFKNAWKLVDGKVTIDMSIARDTWRDFLRSERNVMLQKLDVEFIRALETNDTSILDAIISRKNKLRDLPSHPSIESAQTTDELNLLTIDILLAT